MPASWSRAAQAEPLDAERLRAELIEAGSLWTEIQVLASTGSTNSDVLALARDGAAEGLVIATQEQTSGRGRQGREWLSTPGGALTFSVLLTPSSVPPSARGWVPLLAGLAVATAVRGATSVDASLKWPNDVMVGEGKLAGILAEQSGDCAAIAVGIGLNVLGRPDELPVPTATSLESRGAAGIDRTDLLGQILRELARRYLSWRDAGHGDAGAIGLRADYLRLCRTVGKEVKVALPGGRSLTGTAADVDATGRLVVHAGAAGAVVAVTAGDVIHVR